MALGQSGWGGPGVATECLSLQVKLLELQELVLRLVGERNEWQGRFLAAARSPAEELALGPADAQELGPAEAEQGE